MLQLFLGLRVEVIPLVLAQPCNILDIFQAWVLLGCARICLAGGVVRCGLMIGTGDECLLDLLHAGLMMYPALHSERMLPGHVCMGVSCVLSCSYACVTLPGQSIVIVRKCRAYCRARVSIGPLRAIRCFRMSLLQLTPLWLWPHSLCTECCSPLGRAG